MIASPSGSCLRLFAPRVGQRGLIPACSCAERPLAYTQVCLSHVKECKAVHSTSDKRNLVDPETIQKDFSDDIRLWTMSALPPLSMYRLIEKSVKPLELGENGRQKVNNPHLAPLHSTRPLTPSSRTYPRYLFPVRVCRSDQNSNNMVERKGEWSSISESLFGVYYMLCCS